MRNETEL